MKISFARVVTFSALVGLLLSARPLPADPPEMLSKAEDLVHQAWNPGGDPPPDDQRLDLLTKALKLAQDAGQRHVHGHRVKAIALIKDAMDTIKSGDAEHKAGGMLKDADAELRESLSEST